MKFSHKLRSALALAVFSFGAAACGGHGGGSALLPQANSSQGGHVTAKAVGAAGLDADVLSYGPLAYYRLDETSGTVAHDSSGNGYDGTYSAQVQLGTPSLVAGGTNSATFAGKKANVTLPGALPIGLRPGTNLVNQPMTLVAMINPAKANGVIASYHGFGISIDHGTVGFYGEWLGGQFAYTTKVTMGSPHFVAVTCNCGSGGYYSVLVYVDGKPAVFGNPSAFGNNYLGATTAIGTGGTLGDFGGAVQDVAIYRSVLSSPQICQLANDAGFGTGGCVLPSPSPTPSSSPSSGSPNEMVYVSDVKSNTTFNPNSVQDLLGFAPGNLTGPPTTDITTLNFGNHNSTGALTVDSSGNLWMSNLTPEILEFAPGATGNVTPTRSILPTSTNGQEYWGIAVDSAGEIYAAGTGFAGLQNPHIDVYAANASGLSSPIRSFSGPEMDGSRKLAFDPSGNLWVVGSNTALLEYPASSNGAVSPTINMLQSRPAGGGTFKGCSVTWPVTPRGIAFDAQGNMLIATLSSPNGGAILKFAPPFNSNSCPIAYLSTQLMANDIQVDTNGNIYVIGFGGPNQVDIYPESAMVAGYPTDWSTVPVVSPTSSIIGSSTNLFGPESIAISSVVPVVTPPPTIPHGTVFVTDVKSNTTYNPSGVQDLLSFAPGNLSGSPTTDITTLNSGNHNSTGSITLDSHANLWMSNLTPEILEFAPNATGGATPVRSITPTSTNGQEYWGIALDSAGEIFADGSGFQGLQNPHVDVYAANASGLSSPIRSFNGPELDGTRKLAFDPSGNLWAVGGTNLVAYPANANGATSPLVNMMAPGNQLNGCSTSWPVQPRGIAFDAQGNMLVATISSPNGGAILKFAPPFTSTSCPVAYLSTQLIVYDIATDSNGNIYGVSFGGPNQVDIYPESAMVSGYPADWSVVPVVSPTSSITGPATNIFGPESLAVW